jgi:pimeloyl-ACP methyl ester carboxylesterase
MSPDLCSWTPPTPRTGSNPRQKNRSRSTAAFACAATEPARYGVARIVSGLAALGALSLARGIVAMVSRRDLAREDEGILAPVTRLPIEVRRPLRHFWSRETFFQALGSQIESICTSAAETLEAGANGYGDLPLVTISSTDPGEYRLRQQEALARLSTRGRHVMASNSGHWVPLDQPEIVIEEIARMLETNPAR